jgi:hypothetical protein
VLFVTVRQLIPEGLVEIPPGPELARILAGIELSRLSGYDCVEVLKAQYRQVNHERARLMSTMVEVGLCDIGPDDELPRKAVPGEFAADEVCAALMLTRRAADTQFWLAHDLLARLPAVHAAMDAGALDEPRARVFSEWTTELHPKQARALAEELLPWATRLTTGQLIEQIKKLAITVDPEWARRRYEQAVADRTVVGYRNPDGSANLSGCNLPVHRVAAASGHIDALAKAVKRAGDGRPIDHIRADLFLGMTDGTYSGLDDAEIINQLLATGDVDESGDPTGHHHDGARACAVPPVPQGAAVPVVRGGAGMELRVRLSTLLGQDQYPAELAGWGPVHAELARDLATTLGGAEWRFAITDEQGQLSHCGITRSRPTGTPTRMAGLSRDRGAGRPRHHPARPARGPHWAGCLGRGGDRPAPSAGTGPRRRRVLRRRGPSARSRRRATPLPGDPRPVLHHDRLPGAGSHRGQRPSGALENRNNRISKTCYVASGRAGGGTGRLLALGASR